MAATVALLPATPAAEAGPTVTERWWGRWASDDCGKLLDKPGGGTWSCTFVDNFGGNGPWGGGELDEDKWLAGDTSWSGFFVANTCISASDQNVRLRKGSLVLTARDEGQPFTCETPWGGFETQYTGASVGTRGRFSQAFGRFEVRAKLPASTAPGLHAAFWLYPNDHTYGAWPHSGEIDVAEWWSGMPNRVLPTLHYAGREFWADSGWDCVIDDVNKFHTYAVEWTREEMRFYQDGSLCFRRSWQPDSPLVAPQPFDKPFNIVLTMAVGGSTGTNAVSDQSDLPAEFEIDYVKAWK